MPPAFISLQGVSVRKGETANMHEVAFRGSILKTRNNSLLLLCRCTKVMPTGALLLEVL
jgi:hypothetical protein